MNILYVANVCSKNKYKELFDKKIIRGLPQAQKYHNLILEGFNKNLLEKITVISAYPTNRKWSKTLFYSYKKEEVGGIIYNYSFFLNIFFLRQICLFIFSFLYTIYYIYFNKNGIVFCDVLCRASSLGARIASFILKIKCIGIITDIPGKSSNSLNDKGILKKMLKKIDLLTINKFDGYLLLTQAMNTLVNKNRKPYIVLEGHSDLKMKERKNTIEIKNEKRTIMYSGGIREEYGIKILIEAFLKIQNKEWELHIYGDGNYKNDLIKISSKNKNIKYFGVINNEEIVKQQMKADILINPRLTNNEYTKYSFPSKNMEYMASGTPMIGTLLDGMPKEYIEYIYIIKNETLDGFIEVISKVMNKSREELHEKGEKSKEFVIENKNNLIQTKKIIKFVERILNKEKR